MKSPSSPILRPLANAALLALAVLFAAGMQVRGAQVAAAPRDAWPSFRGTPALTGVSAGRLPASPALKWTLKMGGPVKGAPAIVGGIVYVGAEDEKVRALRMVDGKPVWEFKADGPVVTSPLVLDGRVYVGSAGTNLFALDATTGRELWRYGIEAEVKSSAGWFTAPGGQGKWLVFGGYDNRLHCLDALTGRTNWAYETGNYVNGAPAVAEGLTAFGGCDAIVHVVKLADGSKIKEVEAGAYIVGSAAIVDGFAYVGHYENEFLAVDLKKGEVAWRYRDRAFPYGGSPAVTAERVIFGGRDKRVHAVHRATGKLAWVFSSRGKVESSPVVAGDKVVIGSDDGRVYVLALADGKELWSYEIGQPVQGSPAVVDGHFAIGADDGGIYCFGER